MSRNTRSQQDNINNNLDSDLEAQNDTHLLNLHDKLKQLRGVTTDIYRDSQGQNAILDNTANSFNSFKTSLSSTSNRFVRSVQTGQGQGRLQLSVVGGIIGLFLFYKFFFSSS